MPKKNSLRVLPILLAAALILPLLCFPVSAASAPELSAVSSICLYNITHETLMHEKNARIPVSPASTVKIMTGLLAAELLHDRMNEAVTVTSAMLVGAPQNKIKAGNVLTVEKMLSSLIREKNNDAAFVLAFLSCGSVAAFVQKMNARASELGMTGTRYVNPTGLDESGSVTTAHDVMLLSLAAYDNVILRGVAWEKTYTLSGGTCHVVNAGMTDLGGYCQVVFAEMNASGTTQICIAMGGKTEDETQSAVVQMLRWGANNYGIVNVVKAGQVFRQIPVSGSTVADEINGVAGVGFSLYLPLDVTIGDGTGFDVCLDSSKLTHASLKAPVEKGQELGFVTITYRGETIGTVPLVAGKTVEANSLMASLSSLSNLMSSRAFIAALTCAIVLFGIYFFIELRRYKERKQLLHRYRSEHRHLYR